MGKRRLARGQARGAPKGEGGGHRVSVSCGSLAGCERAGCQGACQRGRRFEAVVRRLALESMPAPRPGPSHPRPARSANDPCLADSVVAWQQALRQQASNRRAALCQRGRRFEAVVRCLALEAMLASRPESSHLRPAMLIGTTTRFLGAKLLTRPALAKGKNARNGSSQQAAEQLTLCRCCATSSYHSLQR